MHTDRDEDKQGGVSERNALMESEVDFLARAWKSDFLLASFTAAVVAASSSLLFLILSDARMQLPRLSYLDRKLLH